MKRITTGGNAKLKERGLVVARFDQSIDEEGDQNTKMLNAIRKTVQRKYCLILIVLTLFVSILLILEYKIHILHEEEHDHIAPITPTVNTQNTPVIPTQEPLFHDLSTEEQPLPNPPQKSKNAYITLLSGINPDFTHRGYLYNALIMKKSLEKLGSTADFIVMIGFQNDPSKGNISPSLYTHDLNLLKQAGIILYELPRYLASNKYKLNFAEMALLKVTPFLLTQYEKIQYFDGDILPTKNMDCFFQLNHYSYTIGAVSPLNSGWYLLIPNRKIYDYFHQKAIWRLTRDWDSKNGWGHPFPPQTFYTRGKHKEVTLWDFNGADMDQGLFLYFFAYFYGHLYLIDTDLSEVYYYHKGIYSEQLLSLQQQLQENPSESDQNQQIQSKLAKSGPPPDLSSIRSTVDVKEALDMCGGNVPTNYFIHFTGHSKPWIEEKNPQQNEKKKKNVNVIRWMKALDDLQLDDVNSSTIFTKKLGAPLGFFNAGFPKGGYKESHK